MTEHEPAEAVNRDFEESEPKDKAERLMKDASEERRKGTKNILVTAITLGTGMIVAAVVFVGMFTDHKAPASHGAGPLSGQWEFAYVNKGAIINGSMNLTQNGANIEGNGVDKTSFVVKGTVDGSQVSFQKQYTEFGWPKGSPITYAGKVDYMKDELPPGQRWYTHISGIWQCSAGQGLWEAGLIKRSESVGGKTSQQRNSY